MKKIVSLILAAVLLCAVLPVMSVSAASTPTANVQSVDLYAINEIYSENLSIPSGYRQSFQLKVSGTSSPVKWYTYSNSVEVSESGLVKPKVITYYWHNGYGTTKPSDDYDRITHEIDFGQGVVSAYVDGVTINVTVNVIDYAEEYAEQVLQKYAKDNFKSDMTSLELLDKIAAFPAQYDYRAYYSSCKSLIINGGGDCWASTEAINRLCEIAGIECYTRKAMNDPGAGGGHINTLAVVDGKYYILDAGFTGTAPRYYEVEEEPYGISYKVKYDADGGYIQIYQYDGNSDEFYIPEEINGYPVKSIGKDTFYNAAHKPVTVHIPATVTDIEENTFQSVEALKNIFVDKNNPVYCDADGILYNKDKTQIIGVPNGRTGDYEILSSADSIFNGAFAGSKLSSVKLSNKIKEIPIGAFFFSEIENITLPSNLDSIGFRAFGYCFGLKSIYIPRSVKSIDKEAFYGIKPIIYGHSGSEAEKFAQENNLSFVTVEDEDKLIGDINLDGIIDIDDVSLLQKNIAGVLSLESDKLAVADMNGDGNIDIEDATCIQKLIAGV